VTQTQPFKTIETANPFLTLNYEPALEKLGDDYYDPVPAAEFPTTILRFRNDELLPTLGLDPKEVTDQDFIEAFGYFLGVRPFLALRYHGYQFGEYNPNLGDGRGFLYGQVRGVDGELYDLGTKGSGKTPYSRTADGRLTLKGGVREVLAAEALQRMGVRTSRCLSLIETGEQLWRGDEPSPTRSSVMIRFSKSHIRFGTFERLHYISRPDLITKLLNHVISQYYPAVSGRGILAPIAPDFAADLSQNGLEEYTQEHYLRFYGELVQRVAELVAQWMAAGFCHAVLNTDNMSITGESFDYGPYAFIPTYNPQFTAAYFDYYGRYSYGNQPKICYWNLQKLQVPLKAAIAPTEMEAALDRFYEYYEAAYRELMLKKLGLENLPTEEGRELVKLTLQVLAEYEVGYHEFFWQLTQQFSPQWREDISLIFPEVEASDALQPWRQLYHHFLQFLSVDELTKIGERLRRFNPQTVLLRPEIEAIWEAIAVEDNWQPFYELLQRIKA
jgi:serine/tyrosine/threonine adenylyltransferase